MSILLVPISLPVAHASETALCLTASLYLPVQQVLKVGPVNLESHGKTGVKGNIQAPAAFRSTLV